MNPFHKTSKQLSIFVTSGYPTLESTVEQIIFLQQSGVDFIELGIPFSDPMADGPIIQESSAIALQNGMTLELLFEQIESIKNEIQIPIVLMGYLNPILKFGLERFVDRAKKCNIKGLIIPDLSYEIVQSHYSELMKVTSIPLIYLITPETEASRISKIAENSVNSFIYLVSSNSITGEGNKLVQNKLKYSEIKKLTKNVPVMLGFGIKTSDDVQLANEVLDGAIIGSEYIRHLSEGKQEEFIQSIIKHEAITLGIS